MGPKTETDFLPKVSREKRGTVSNEVSRERSVLSSLFMLMGRIIMMMVVAVDVVLVAVIISSSSSWSSNSSSSITSMVVFAVCHCYVSSP